MHVSISSMLQRFGKGRDGAPWAWSWHRNLTCGNYSNSNEPEHFSGSAWCMANFKTRAIWSHLKACQLNIKKLSKRNVRDSQQLETQHGNTWELTRHMRKTRKSSSSWFFLLIAKDWLEDSTFQPSMYSWQGASTSPSLEDCCNSCWPISNGSHSPTSWGDDDENSDQLQPGLEDAEDFSAKDFCILLWNWIADLWDSRCVYCMMCCSGWSSIKELGQRQGGAYITSPQFLSQRKPDFPRLCWCPWNFSFWMSFLWGLEMFRDPWLGFQWLFDDAVVKVSGLQCGWGTQIQLSKFVTMGQSTHSRCWMVLCSELCNSAGCADLLIHINTMKKEQVHHFILHSLYIYDV